MILSFLLNNYCYIACGSKVEDLSNRTFLYLKRKQHYAIIRAHSVRKRSMVMSEPDDESLRERATRPRADVRRTERLAPDEDDHEPVNPGWRSERLHRATSRR